MTQDPTVLLTPAGRELAARLAADDRPASLALATSLRREYPASLVAAAAAQQELRLAARAKFTRAMEMLFTRAGYEQSSSEAIARYRAGRFGDARRVADLCCGIGGDLLALASAPGGPGGPGGRDVLAVDLEETHARLARHNAGVYGAAERVRAVVADVRELTLDGLDGVFIDPARRAGEHRFRAGVSQPPLEWCLALRERVPAVCVKAAPGLPAELIPAGWEAEFIADGRDLKEAVLWSPALASAGRRATVLPGGDTLTVVPGDPVPVTEPGEYLLDPNPAVTRAGLVEDLARLLARDPAAAGNPGAAGHPGAAGDPGARDPGAARNPGTAGAAGTVAKIDPRIAFLTADFGVRTPFARTLRVLHSAPWNEKRFARQLRDLGVGAADIRRRGLAGDVDQIHRRLKLDGPHRATIVITRVSDRPWGLICAEPGGGDQGLM
jgi:predicted O-methyltransferase YrrM